MNGCTELVSDPPMGAPGLPARTRADKTEATAAPYVVRMRTVEWPQRDAFIRTLETIKERHGFRTDLALAESAGISHTTISNWRRGLQRPSLDALHKLAAATGEAAHTLAEVAGIVDPERFGRAAPPPAGGVDALSEEVQKVLDDAGLPEDDRFEIAQMLVEEFGREEHDRRRQQAERARATIQTWKRARGA